jgi:hypothetical protein
MKEDVDKVKVGSRVQFAGAWVESETQSTNTIVKKFEDLEVSIW